MVQPLHEDEVPVTIETVRQLLEIRQPHLAHLEISEAPSPGTSNTIYRLGDALCVRMPRSRNLARSLSRELECLPQFRGSMSLSIPEPVFAGTPSPEFPLPWAIYRWLDGTPLDRSSLGDEVHTAAILAGFIVELRAVDPNGGLPSRRDRPLRERDGEVRTALSKLDGEMDTRAVAKEWAYCLEGVAFEEQPGAGQSVWTHGDLLPPNMLQSSGALTAVIDFGNVGVGDPAVDLIPAWTVLHQEGREAFRAALEVDEPTWRRSRGMALHQAVLIIPYYRDTNPAFAEVARATAQEIMEDAGRG